MAESNCAHSPSELASLSLECIATAITPYREKFAVPRQAGLVTADCSYLRMSDAYNHRDWLRGLDGFSHIWLLWRFHLAQQTAPRPLVRPPRLGGNQKVGVFASRSPFRPNAIGLSVVKLLGIHCSDGRWQIDVQGCDLVHGTPILDIKPYLPWSDSLPEAVGHYAHQAPHTYQQNDCVFVYSKGAQQALAAAQMEHASLRELIEQLIRQQPQPAYQNSQGRGYGMSLYNYNVRWCFENASKIVIESIEWLREK